MGARIVAGKPQAIPAQTPKFTRKFATLAVTDEELAPVSHTGVWRVTAGEVIARVPRSDVASAEVGRGVASQLKVTLADVIELLSRERDHERPAGRRSD
jgi:hypothetical protein